MLHSPHPNVLFILDDQHRHDYLGCAGADFVDTPHIDALASRGIHLTHCCTTAPICGPSRIAMATGLIPPRTGTTSNQTAYMPMSVPNFYRHFRDNGYRVQCIGRHDLAKPNAPMSQYGNRPLNFSYGFTHAIEMEGAMAATRDGGISGPYTRFLHEHGYLEKWFEDNRQRLARGWIIGASHDSVLPLHLHQDSFVGDVAVDRILHIEEDYPWYMQVNFQSPHDPYDPPTALADKYRDANVPDPIPVCMQGKPRRIVDRYERLYQFATPEDITLARRQYCATIELIDRQVGKLVQALKDRDMLDNTIIVFASDHGDHVGDHGLFIKHTAYEPSLRVPLVMAGPGIEPQCCDALVETIDINPTLCELADLEQLPHIDGRSFVPVIQKQSTEHREACATYEEGYSSLRTEQYKYIDTLNDMTELYDLKNDPAETTNIIDQQPELTNHFKQQLRQRLTEGKWQH